MQAILVIVTDDGDSFVNNFVGSLSRAILDGKISKRCEVCGLVYIVNYLFAGTTDDVL